MRRDHNGLKNAVIEKIKAFNNGVIPYAFVTEGLTNKDALDLERKLIMRFGRRDISTGILTNLTNGGEGAMFLSETTRQKMSERMIGAGSPTYGVGHTEESRKKMSLGQKARVAKGLITRHSEEHKRRLRENNKGGLATRKQVLQLKPSGEIVNSYASLTTLATELGMSKGNCLALVVKDGSIPKNGFFYRYLDSLDISSSGIANADYLIKKRERVDRNALSGKPVAKMSLEGETIAIYESVKEAGRQNPHLKDHNIYAAIYHNRLHDGFYWRKA